ncbi:uncharacterized protein LACBIDRAFT_318591 [Laccaria bicolor S238N-H82]|uniref:Predicted protein n=1 Tax=Laccaria bicolor (strain S238N-H82 / ATCC MYA-4686) TaxID=486041 RepID=B0E2Q6_LACBS|nr:uncharacterized protein LACBIDRAFT_318591 [Laccaria bicolor S238N-H82]EDQ98863.1 predicted protein [Laccaria bicolor S238N-H82]|eukprot:XP_001890473.1 predicted protein [Laccaria bicolor S238N-H82]
MPSITQISIQTDSVILSHCEINVEDLASDYTETDDDGSRASESGSDNEQEL